MLARASALFKLIVDHPALMTGSHSEALSETQSDFQLLENSFQIIRESRSTPQGWPQLQSRLHRLVRKRDRSQVVMKKRPLAAIQRVTCQALSRPAFSPATGAADVVALRISQKNIRPAIHLLGSTFQLPAQTGQRFEVSLLFDLNQEVDIFGILFVGCD
jgi:hypothetical protein